MTQDAVWNTHNVIRLATEAGLCSVSNGFVDWIDAGPSLYEMTLFAKLVAEHERKEFAVHAVDVARRAVAEEREACAKLVEKLTPSDANGVNAMANAIRAKGQA